MFKNNKIEQKWKNDVFMSVLALETVKKKPII